MTSALRVTSCQTTENGYITEIEISVGSVQLQPHFRPESEAGLKLCVLLQDFRWLQVSSAPHKRFRAVSAQLQTACLSRSDMDSCMQACAWRCRAVYFSLLRSGPHPLHV